MRIFPLLFALLIGLGQAGAKAEEKRPVVASFSILGDLVRQVGKDRVEVAVLVGPGADAHTFEPSPADAKRVAQAKVMFVNGLGFEGWLARLVAASGGGTQVIEVARTIKEGKDDPHVWQAVPNVKIMVDEIRRALAAADPEGRESYARNAAAYLVELEALDRDIRAAVAGIPPERRQVVTSHDAFAHFSTAYGIAFIAPQGVSAQSEASAKSVAAIIHQIRRERIPALFLENLADARLIRQIAEETGAKIGGTLFSDTLSDDSGPAGTYIAMMRHNIRELTRALAP